MVKVRVFNLAAGCIFSHICVWIAILLCFSKIRFFIAAYHSLGYGDTFFRLLPYMYPNPLCQYLEARCPDTNTFLLFTINTASS
jgi:hypothetical protein